jgi:hypothetical protein
MSRALPFSLVVVFFVNSAVAGLVPTSFTGTPQGSWSYSEQANAGHGQSISYFPTTSAEFQGAVFQGFVTYNAGTPASYWFGQGFDSFQIFSTSVQSPVAMTLPLILGGDDGHSLFINGQFVGGGGFGDNGVSFDLTLQPGVPVQIVIAGYNGPGPFAFDLGLRPNFDPVLENVPGLLLNANGIFPAITAPEPMSVLLWTIAAAAATAIAFRKNVSLTLSRRSSVSRSSVR